MSKIAKILVPIDFSTDSKAALTHAIDLARSVKATLHLLHSYHVPISMPVAFGPPGIPADVAQSIRETAAKHLAEWASHVKSEDVDVRTHLVEGPAAEAICETAEEIAADQIVMGTRGLTGIKHVVFGSVAERTVRLAPCPVTTVKAPAE